MHLELQMVTVEWRWPFKLVTGQDKLYCIDRLHVSFDILVILFLYFFCTFFLCGANRLYVRLSLSHDFEQFGSMHMCALRKDIGCSGIQTQYPRTLSQPRYQ